MDRQKEIEAIKGIIRDAEKMLLLIQAHESTPEPKEPETWEGVADNCYGGFDFSWDCDKKEHVTELEKFIKRLEIADYCGRREFVTNGFNWLIERHNTDKKWNATCYETSYNEGTNYFPTQKAAEKYLKICLNSNLL